MTVEKEFAKHVAKTFKAVAVRGGKALCGWTEVIREAFLEEVGLESSIAGQEELGGQGGIHSREGKYFEQR